MKDVITAGEAFNTIVSSLEMCAQKGAFTLEQAAVIQTSVMTVSQYLQDKIVEHNNAEPDLLDNDIIKT